ncbi:epidermal patterning factor-like protein 8 [Babesia caballi]|uniref:Epidermal patterning factor-like protein 8 n=1 Tax=Babesia caballi TaxID=5871 RepID=A0AAV4LYT9_BABCB|nr:epidermal patterning factor-like protein 8 [Babesia caballi]
MLAGAPLVPLQPLSLVLLHPLIAALLGLQRQLGLVRPVGVVVVLHPVVAAHGNLNLVRVGEPKEVLLQLGPAALNDDLLGGGRVDHSLDHLHERVEEKRSVNDNDLVHHIRVVLGQRPYGVDHKLNRRHLAERPPNQVHEDNDLVVAVHEELRFQRTLYAEENEAHLLLAVIVDLIAGAVIQQRAAGFVVALAVDHAAGVGGAQEVRVQAVQLLEAPPG